MAVDLSQALRDIYYPPPISIWPLAIGWYFLIAIVLLLLMAFVFFWIRIIKKNKLKKIVLKRLTELQQQQDQYNIAEELSMLLKRVVLARYPRCEVAGLYGEQWLVFLDKTASTTEFSQGIGRLLIVCPYSAKKESLPDSLFHLIQGWVKRNL